MSAPTMAPARPSRTGTTFPRVLRSEWIKTRTVRSTIWTLALTVVLMVGFSTLLSWGVSSSGGQGGPGAESGSGLAVFMVTIGYGVAQLTLAVLGVLAITTEYSTGMIRSTFAASPDRLRPLGAKALVVVAMAVVTSAVGVALSWLATLGFQSSLGVHIDLADADTRRILLGVPLYLATIALFGFAIGALLRRTAGAMAVVLGLLLVVEPLIANIPVKALEAISPFLPGTAGGRLLAPSDQLAIDLPHRVDLGPWQGYAVLVAWTVLLLAIGALAVRKRDA